MIIACAEVHLSPSNPPPHPTTPSFIRVGGTPAERGEYEMGDASLHRLARLKAASSAALDGSVVKRLGHMSRCSTKTCFGSRATVATNVEAASATTRCPKTTSNLSRTENHVEPKPNGKPRPTYWILRWEESFSLLRIASNASPMKLLRV